MRFLVATVLLIAVLASAVAAETVSLSGIVLAPGERGGGPWSRYMPLEGVRVEVRGPGVFATTDEMGRFRLPGLAEGDHEIVLKAPGYREFRRRIRVERTPPRGVVSFVMQPLETAER